MQATASSTEEMTTTAVTEITIEVTEASTGLTVTTEVIGMTMGGAASMSLTVTIEVTGMTIDIPVTTGGLGSVTEDLWS